MKILKPYYRRRLPHYQPADSILFATFRLANSLPKETLAQLYREREENEKALRNELDFKRRIQLKSELQKKYFKHFDDYLDRVCTDIHWLEQPEIAKIVYEAILFYDSKEYDVVAFCVMPNHVHLVVDMHKRNTPLHNMLQRIKSFSAVNANPVLKRSGSFWQRENYDHVVRDGEELKRIVNYVIENPVEAGLCKKWDEWKWTYLNSDYLYGVE